MTHIGFIIFNIYLNNKPNMSHKKYHYVYLTTNLKNGKQYVGDHSTNNLNDGYLGSGLLIIKSIKKYGLNNFKREILEFFKTKKEAFSAQERYINEYNTLNNGYNISPKGGHNVKNCFSEESKKKISLNRSGKCCGEKHPNFGKHLSEKTKEKLRIANDSTGTKNGMFNTCAYKIWVKKYGKKEADKRNKILSEKKRIAITGIKRSPETIEKYRLAALNRKKYKCQHCNKLFDAGNFKQHIKSLRFKDKVRDKEV